MAVQVRTRTSSTDANAGARALPAYIDDGTCANCHASEFGAWQGSHHDLAMQEATEDTVLGDFGDAEFTRFGVTSRFFSRDGRYLVNTEGPDGQPGDFEIAYTFGVEPLQQYLIGLGGGRLQSLSLAWDSEAGRWFHLSPEANIPPGDPFHWTGLYQNWNLMCAACHSTNLRKNYDAGSGTYNTTWSAIDVGCQACHGPGEDHAASPETDLLVRFGERDAAYAVDQCGACHSRRYPVSVAAIPGDALLDHYVPETLRAGLYYPDGQILDEVYVYGSFVQSRMYAEGVGCTDCHDPHGLGLRAPGNALCTGCHESDYDSGAHHFHEAGTEAAQCVNCHMPARTYMVVDPRRDHSFRIPRPDLSVTAGSPNACSGCHTDESPEWAAQAIARWHPDRPEYVVHHGEVFALARSGSPDSLAPLLELAGDASRPAIVRATALDLLPTFGSEGVRGLTAGLADPNPLVRYHAVSGLDVLPPSERLGIVGPLLFDPVRAVRTEAARVLAFAGLSPAEPERRDAFDRALAEYEAVQRSMADAPAALANLALIHAANGDASGAIRDFEEALEIDPHYLPASLNLAMLLNQVGRNEDAAGVLNDAIALAPEEGEARYSLGLVLAETGRLEEASESLGEAVRILPEDARVRYNYGLSLQRLGRRAEAETALLAAYGMEPETPAFVAAVVILYVQDERWADALPYARELVSLVPADPAARGFLASAEAGAGR